MSVRTFSLTGTLLDVSGAPRVGLAIPISLIVPGNVPAVDTDSKGVLPDLLSPPVVTDGAGHFSVSLLYPGDVSPSGCIYSITIGNSTILSPADFAYSSTIAITDWYTAASGAVGTLPMSHSLVLSNDSPVSGRYLHITPQQNTVAPNSKELSATEPLDVLLDGTGTGIAYLWPTLSLTPNTYYTCRIDGETTKLSFSVPGHPTGYVGVYDGATTYHVHDGAAYQNIYTPGKVAPDVVSYSGAYYVAIADTTGHLPTDATYWAPWIAEPITWHLTPFGTVQGIPAPGSAIADATTGSTGVVELRTAASGAHPIALTVDDLGAASGVAELDSGSHVPLSELSGITHTQLSASAGITAGQIASVNPSALTGSGTVPVAGLPGAVVGSVVTVTGDVSNPPTKAELVSAIGAASGTTTQATIVNDNAAALNEYLSLSDGTTFWSTLLAKARLSASTASATNAGSAQSTPTYDTSGQGVEPHVLAFPDKWPASGSPRYKYWMAYTPYPASNAAFENPSMLASDDGTTWVVPTGLTNPIVAAPGSGNNGDPCIVMDTTNTTMYYYFVTVASGTTAFKVMSSTDGVTWGSPATLFSEAGGEAPSVVYDAPNTQYVLYYENTTAFPATLKRRTCATPTGTWSSATSCTISGAPSGRGITDSHIAKRGAFWHGFFVFWDSGTSTGSYKLYFAESTDGLAWAVAASPLIDVSASGWDNKYVYRGNGVPTATGYDFWYSGMNASGVWHIGRTTITLNNLILANTGRIIQQRDTAAMVQSFGGTLEEGALAYATDTNRLGIYSGGAWHWSANLSDSTGGAGTVTSVAVSVPSWLSVAGSPVITSGTLAVSAASGQAANRVIATPDGAPGAVSLRALVAGDLPLGTNSVPGALQGDGTTTSVTAGVVSVIGGAGGTTHYEPLCDIAGSTFVDRYGAPYMAIVPN